MNATLMLKAQNRFACEEASGGRHELRQGEAVTVAAVPRTRWLAVTLGRVWATRHGSLSHPADDLMLHAGAWLRVSAGEAWVVEGWPGARLELIELTEAPSSLRPQLTRENAAGASAAPRAQRPRSWWQQAWASHSGRLPKLSHSFLF